ncbi:MAG TPA: hypothetical protein VG895_01520 [Patescibacteria group bacterium]|nr:hypothetical protein [Patescibacteria group bacterium]
MASPFIEHELRNSEHTMDMVIHEIKQKYENRILPQETAKLDALRLMMAIDLSAYGELMEPSVVRAVAGDFKDLKEIVFRIGLGNEEEGLPPTQSILNLANSL